MRVKEDGDKVGEVKSGETFDDGLSTAFCIHFYIRLLVILT